MTYLGVLAGVLIAFSTTALIIPVISRLALRKGWVDRPDNLRKVHTRPTPTVGGVAIAAGFAAGIAYFLTVQHRLPFAIEAIPDTFWVGALIMIGVGFYDDVRGLGFKGKLVTQVSVAYLLLHAGYRIDLSSLPFVDADPYNQALYSIPLTMIWIVGVINAVNLIDGLDGLAGGVTLIAFISLAAVFGVQGELGLILVALLIGGALLGFLIHNFSPATIFMGDSGSLFLGYLLAVFSLSGKTHSDPLLALLVPIVALGFPVLDTALSIARRIAARRAVCAPDSDHIHHRLRRLLPTSSTVLVLYGVSICFGLAAVLMSVLAPALGLWVLATTAAMVFGFLSILGYLKPSEPPSTAELSAGAGENLAAPHASGDGHSNQEVDVTPTSRDRDLHSVGPIEERMEVANA